MSSAGLTTSILRTRPGAGPSRCAAPRARRARRAPAGGRHRLH